MLNILKLVADEIEGDVDSAGISLAQKQLDIERLQSARNHLKFRLFMNEGTARSIDEGRTRQLIINIVNRLNGIVSAVPPATKGMVTSADETTLEIDPFSHRDFISIPYGTPIKNSAASDRVFRIALTACILLLPYPFL
jgi:hypothetical protein